MGKTTSSGYYAVAKGFQTGIFQTWAECESKVKGFPGAKYKKFSTSSEAENFISQWASTPKLKQNSSAPSLSNQSNMGATRRFASAPYPSSPQMAKVIASAKRKVGDENRRTQLLETPPSKLTTKRHRVDSPQIKKGISSMDGEQVYLPFLVDEEQFVNVYTDGACRDNGRANPQAGVGVWFGDDHPLNISKRVDGPPTNNTAEIQAARLAIETAIEAGFKKLKINTDSAFLINCATQWLPKWKTNGWKLTSGGDVKNRLELEKLDRAQQNITIYWNKVPAHSGVHGNEMADRLANAGASK